MVYFGGSIDNLIGNRGCGFRSGNQHTSYTDNIPAIPTYLHIPFPHLKAYDCIRLVLLIAGKYVRASENKHIPAEFHFTFQLIISQLIKTV